ncbi:MAG: DUF167 domain-containing protein [Candidatus Odinarchaeia archaeon]
MLNLSAFTEKPEGIVIRVHVKPKSHKTIFPSGFNEEYVEACIRSPPKQDKANIELIKTIAKKLRISTDKITLISGRHDRIKSILVRGITLEKIKKILFSK